MTDFDAKLLSFNAELKKETIALVREAVARGLKDSGLSFAGLSDNRSTGSTSGSTAWYTHNTESTGHSAPNRPGGAQGPGSTFLGRPSALDNTDPAANPGVDHQAEFAVIKDSLTRYKLPVDLKFTPNAVGIKREDKGAYNIVKSTASYVEANLKILSVLESGGYSQAHAANDLSIVNTALMKFLKEEHASLLVQGKFNKDTASMFKALRKEGNSFSQDSLDTLQLAANLTQYNNNSNSNSD